MGNRNIFKILLDVVMTVLFLYLMFGFGTSIIFHEIAGIGIGILFVIHVYLNYQPLKRLYNMVKKRKSTLKNAILFWSDLAFGLGMIVVMVTGIMISRVIFSFEGSLLLSQIHTIASYVCLGILVLHLGLHLKYVQGMSKYFFTHLENKQVQKAIGSFCVAAVVFGLFFSRVYAVYNHKNEFTIVSENKNSTSQGTGNDAIAIGPEPNDTDSTIEEGTSNNETVESDTQEDVTVAETNAPTVEEYLGDLVCTACPRHCPLLTPRCMKGERQKQSEIAVYEQQYGQVST